MEVWSGKQTRLRQTTLAILLVLAITAFTFNSSCSSATANDSADNTWITFLGGSGNDNNPHGIAADSSGNVYICGYSYATWKGNSDPVRPYASSSVDPRGTDAFAAKLDKDGKLVWNTFLGENGNEYGYGIAVDGIGNVYVSGYCNATWRGDSDPVRAFESGYDAFLAKLDSSGALLWNTFLGGSGDDYAWGGIAIDDDGNIYLGGHSNTDWKGNSLPVRVYTSGCDAFAAKLDNNGNLLWNTFMGGNGDDFGRGIAVDSAGSIFLGGHSNAIWKGNSEPLRAYTSGCDAFIAKLDSSGVLLWNTFLGGDGIDYGWSISVDRGGHVYLSGHSTDPWKGGSDPVRAYDSGCDAFAAKLDSGGVLLWNTFLGGGGADLGFGIATDGVGNVYTSGYSHAAWKGDSDSLRAYTSGQDAFAVKLDSSGALLWNTFLGGSGADLSYGIEVDESGHVYLGGYSYTAWKGDSDPVRAYTSGADAFVVKMQVND